MRLGKYITGAKIRFNKMDNGEIITEFSSEVEGNMLLTGLFALITDVCDYYNISTKETIKAYLETMNDTPKKRRGRPRKENK